MKKLRNLLFAFILVAVAAVVLPAKAEAATTATYTYTNDSVTVKWQKPTDSYGSEVITKYMIYDCESKTYLASKISADTYKYTVKNLGMGYVGRWRIDYEYYNVYYNTDGSVSSKYGPYTTSNTYLYVNTTPTTYTTKNFAVNSILTSTKKVNFAAPRYNEGDYSYDTAVQLKLYKGSKFKKTLYIKYNTSDYISIASNTVYKFKVRGYFTNPDTGKTYYGKWSSFKYFDFQSSKVTYKYGTRGAKVPLKKVSNVSKYVIYVSTSKDSGFKKTMTVKKPSSSTKTVRVKKIGSKNMKKGKTYYIKVVPYIKVGSKLKKSDVSTLYSIYNYK